MRNIFIYFFGMVGIHSSENYKNRIFNTKYAVFGAIFWFYRLAPVGLNSNVISNFSESLVGCNAIVPTK